MVVKGDNIVSEKYVVSSKIIHGNDAFCIKTRERRIAKVAARQNVTGSVAEEYPVWECPSANRIILNARFQLVHLITLSTCYGANNSVVIVVHIFV